MGEHQSENFDAWNHALADGYRAATVKGNPYEAHAKKPGEWSAVCGKTPGNGSPGYKMKNRVGWMIYSNGAQPSCQKCRAAIISMFAEATKGGGL